MDGWTEAQTSGSSQDAKGEGFVGKKEVLKENLRVLGLDAKRTWAQI